MRIDVHRHCDEQSDEAIQKPGVVSFGRGMASLRLQRRLPTLGNGSGFCGSASKVFANFSKLFPSFLQIFGPFLQAFPNFLSRRGRNFRITDHRLAAEADRAEACIYQTAGIQSTIYSENQKVAGGFLFGDGGRPSRRRRRCFGLATPSETVGAPGTTLMGGERTERQNPSPVGKYVDRPVFTYLFRPIWRK